MIIEYTTSHDSGSDWLQNIRCCGRFRDREHFAIFCRIERERGWIVRTPPVQLEDEQGGAK